MESINRRISNIESHLLSCNGCSASDDSRSSSAMEPIRPFNPDKLFDYLFPHYLPLRRELISFFESPACELLQRAPFGMSLADERDLTFAQTKELLEIAKRYIKVSDFINDPTRIAAWTQSYRLRNIGTTTLFGVHYSLFGATILQLGTDEQRDKYLKHVEDFTMPGCFALTELGHGSNVQQIETQAVYDHSTEEFVINSPTITSQKYFIGGAAKHARWTVAFARLKVGEKYEGVHAFLVRIRNEDGTPCTGVKIADCGVKMALNGVDNGRLMFVNTRVPRDQLLSRFGGVNKAGIYSSPINPANKRFAHSIGALVIGRYIISIGCVSFSAVGLITAINYAFTRRQFGEDDQERQLITYAVHQRRLLPHLALNFGIHFANDYLLRLIAEKVNKKDKEIHVIASALKAYSSWHNRDCLQDCREACGGQGFLAENLVGPFKSETEIYTTFEGDNVLMYQQVAKHFLSEARRNPPPEYSPPSDATRTKTDSKYLRSYDFMLQAMTARLNQYVVFVANKLMEAVGNGKSVMDAWNDCGNLILNLGIVFSDKFVIERFIDGVVKCPDINQRNSMSLLLSLMGLTIINKDQWFIKYQYISLEQSDAIENEISALCKEIAPISVALAESFGYSTKSMGPISRDWVAENKY